MESKFNLYMEGTLVDPDVVMQVALTRYEISLDQKTWKAPPKKNKVVAMIAKEKEVKKPKKDDKEDESPPQRERDAWKQHQPQGNEKTQVRKGKTYNW
jgi:hypothetical protein